MKAQRGSTLKPLQIELREAMEEWGCPLCKLAHKAEQAFIESLNYERVLDLKTRDDLKASRGLCERHSRAWRQVQGSALGMAIVYRVTILDLIRDTEGDDKDTRGFLGLRSDRRSPKQIAETLEAQAPCPACEVGEGTSLRFAELLLDDLKNESVQSLLRDSGGLCLPHLRMSLRQKGAHRNALTLIAVHREAWMVLMGELEEFIRKNDYRFREETMTSKEETAWTRVLDVVVGLTPGRKQPHSQSD